MSQKEPQAGSAARRLEVPEDLLEALLDEARASYPREACGVLIGRAEADRWRVVALAAARNLAPEPDRFDVHPTDFLAADRTAREAGATILGLWHSHPDRPAVPSAADLEGGLTGWCHLIVAQPAGKRGNVRAWAAGVGRWAPLVLDWLPTIAPHPFGAPR